MERLSEALLEAVLAVGMTAVASGLVSGPRRLEGDLFHFVNWPQDWLERYLSEGYVDKDPVPRWAMVSGTPVSWTELLKTLSPDDPGHEVYVSAAKWRFTEGFVTPARGMDGSAGLVSVGGERGALLPRECLYLQSVSVTAFHRAEAIASLASDAFLTLSARESLASARTSTYTLQQRRDVEIRRLFALTPAEWRVASGLYKGESLQGLAVVNNVSVNTLRVQLASVYTKTNTHRQTELVAVIRSLVEVREPSRPDNRSASA